MINETEKKNGERKIPLSRNNIKKDLHNAEIERLFCRIDWPMRFGIPVFLLSSMLLMLIREEYRTIAMVLWIIFALSSVVMVWMAICFLRFIARTLSINAGKFKLESLPLDHVEKRIIFEPHGVRWNASLFKSVWYFYFPSKRWRVANIKCHYKWSWMSMDTRTLIDDASEGGDFYVVILDGDVARGNIEYVYSAKIFEYDEN